MDPEAAGVDGSKGLLMMGCCRKGEGGRLDYFLGILVVGEGGSGGRSPLAGTEDGGLGQRVASSLALRRLALASHMSASGLSTESDRF